MDADVPAARLAVIESLAAGIPPQDKGFAPTLLRARIPSGRDVLAHRATHGRHLAAGLDEIGMRAAEPRGPVEAGAIAGFEPELVAAYAQVSALQLGDERGRQVGLGLYRLLDRAGKLAGCKRRHLDLYPQLLYASGQFDDARSALATKLTAPVADFLGADLAHPDVTGGEVTDGNEDAWLAALSAALAPSPETAGVRLHPGAEGLTRLDRLTAATPLAALHGPLVTVITSAFKPSQPLLTAARSMIEQSWQDWELLIVDDASPPGHEDVLEQVEALDPRIRVIHKAVNGGTYRCRNTALRQARGDFVTCLDSDDWAHPQRLELGLAPLLAQPGLMATRSLGIRADEQLRVTRPGYLGPFVAASSLLFRMPHVPGRIGFFDTVRKAADTEYARRIAAAYGHEVYDIPRDILTILRSSPESLSADDFAAGWRHEARPAYKQAYTRWHEAINHAGAEPFFDPDGERPFPAPRRWTRPVDAQLAAPEQFDIVLGGDWRRYGGPQISMMQEIAACTAAGMRVGVLHLEALRFYTSVDQPLCAPLQELIGAGTVERVFPDDDIDVDILQIRYPPILQFPPALPKAFSPKRLFVMANQAPFEPDGSDPRYVPADITANARALFGVEPMWIPQGPTIRALLDGLVAPQSITTWDNPGLIDIDAWYVRPDRPVHERPVVGRFSRDDRIKFPDDPADLLAAYGLPERYDVRILGGAVTVPKLLGQAGVQQPANWTLFEHKEIDVRAFLAGLDFVVYMDNPNAYEAFGRALLESATSGAVCIAAPKHAATFGEACLYAEPADVPALLDRLVGDPQAYRAQVVRAHSWIEQHFSTASFAERVRQVRAEIAREEIAAATPPSAAGEASGAPGWVTFTTRRLADGESGDELAARHTGEAGAREAALATLRALVATAPAGMPLDAPTVAAAWRAGVTDVAQRVGGQVVRYTA
ncbi:MAG: glycosyltransferase [Tetrasphaera sp.]